MIKLLYLLSPLLLIACSSAPIQGVDDSKLIGLTIAESIKLAQLTPTKHLVVDEPPSVARAVRTHDEKGNLVELYIKRGDVPLNLNRDWQLTEFANKKAVGVARAVEKEWKTTGDVIHLR